MGKFSIIGLVLVCTFNSPICAQQLQYNQNETYSNLNSGKNILEYSNSIEIMPFLRTIVWNTIEEFLFILS
jgi:hypothetical protein